MAESTLLVISLCFLALLAFTPDYSAIRAIPEHCAAVATYTMAATGLYDYVNTVRHIERGAHEVGFPTRLLGSKNIIGIGLIMGALDYGISRISSPTLRCAGEVFQTVTHVNAIIWSNRQ